MSLAAQQWPGRRRSVLPVLVAWLLACAGAVAQDGPHDGTSELVPRDWLVIGPLDGGGRRPFTPDAVFAAHLLDPRAEAPAAGGELQGELGASVWEPRQADEQGQLEGPLGWAYAKLRVSHDVVMLAETSEVRDLFVNGVGFAGDIYGLDRGPVAVALKPGSNHVFVKPRSGGFRLRLLPTPGPLVLSDRDDTLPDLLAGQPFRGLGGVVLLNASTDFLSGVTLTVGDDEVFARRRAEELPRLPPLTLLKLPIPLDLLGAAPEAGSTVPLPLVLSAGPRTAGAERTLELAVRTPTEAHRRTFLSRLDRSVQGYAVLPPASRAGERSPRWLEPDYDPLPGERDAAVLSLHGAGVDSLKQARAYSPKNGLWIVAPTNRGQFGFDWQDWGRLDAYEVLRDARLAFQLEPRRTWLTGHSMGGHGTWHLAANDPYGFLAAAPSAGWCSFDTYGGRPEGSLADLWQRADGASRTEALIDNLVQVPVFILHGRDDDNVPLSEAQAMEALLKQHGADPRVHYQPSAGHWWDGQRAAGADCVDWPDIFRMFAEVEAPRLLESIDLNLPVPVEGPPWQWLRPLQSEDYGAPLHLAGRWNAAARRIEVTTANVRRFGITGLAPLTHAGAPGLSVDGTTLELPPGGAWIVERDAAENWVVSTGMAAIGQPIEKSPGAQGPFKQAFTHDFVLVYPTRGDDDQLAVSLARARHDAQVWWYRGNGCARLVSDVEWLEHGDAWDLAGNVVLYGNADTNAAWDLLIGGDGPIQVGNGLLQVGAQSWRGEDLGCVFVRPRGRRHLVGAVASTGARGDRLGDTLNLFVSGVGFPDYVAFGARVLSEGDDGVLAAGFFDSRWRLDGRGFVAEGTPEGARKR